jgi:DnaJ-class molecular chaperone
MAKQEQKRKICVVCGGTGRVRFFQGVSRFLLSDEECDACAGTGYKIRSMGELVKERSAGKRGKKKENK